MEKEIFTATIVFHPLSKGALAEEFNYSFIRGGSKDIPDVLNSNKENVPGKYVVSVVFSGSKAASSAEMSIVREDAEGMCLSDEWLTKNGIIISEDFYENVYNSTRQCYLSGNEANSKVAFDQSL